MPQAIWNDTVIAESDDTVIVDGNHYFPADAIRKEFYEDSSAHTVCHWKGQASYFDIVVDGQRNPGAAWYYPDPKKKADNLGIKNRVAFWKGVRVQ